MTVNLAVSYRPPPPKVSYRQSAFDRYSHS